MAQGRQARRRLENVLLAAVVALVACAVHGGALDNFFHEIDDAALIWGAEVDVHPTWHFRPLQHAWNRALLALAGTEPFGWYAGSLALHVVNSLLAAALVGAATGSRRAGLVGGVAFAAFHSGNEAVAWLSASTGLIAVAGLLASGLAWVRHLRTGGAVSYALALLGLAVAMGAKEDAVLAAPLLLGLDLALRGRRALLARGALLRYAPFALLGALYLALALRPSYWADVPDVGAYSLRPSLVPKLLANVALLPWPRDVPRPPPLAAPAGALLLALLAAAARLAGERGRWIALGTALAVAALLPVLPGPDDMRIAGTRYAYPAAIGVAFVAGALFDGAWVRSARLRASALPRTALAGALALWVLVQLLSVRSVEEWRHERKCERFARLLADTRALALDPGRPGPVAVVAPDVWNLRDYVAGLHLLERVPPERVRVERAPLDATLDARLGPGGDLDPAAVTVLTSPPGDSGALVRLADRGDVPRESWREVASVEQHRGLGYAVPVVWILPGTPSGARSP